MLFVPKIKKTLSWCVFRLRSLAWLCRLVSLMHDCLSSLTANENTAVMSHRGGTELLFELWLTSDLFLGGWINKGGKEWKSTDTQKRGLFMPDLNWISIQQLNTAWYGWQNRCKELFVRQQQKRDQEWKSCHYLLTLLLFQSSFDFLSSTEHKMSQ